MEENAALLSKPTIPFDFFDLLIEATTRPESGRTGFGILFGLAPAFAAVHAELAHGLKETALTTTRRRKGMGGKALVGFQIALSMLLVIGAGLFLRTLAGLSAVNIGFRTDHLLLVVIDPPAVRYPAGQDIALHQRLEETFGAVPGVQSVTAGTVPYLEDGASTTDFLPQGETYDQYKSQSEDFNWWATVSLEPWESRSWRGGLLGRKIAAVR